MDQRYIKRLQSDNKTLIIVALNTNDRAHNFVHDLLLRLAMSNTKYLFSYLDLNEDQHFSNYFGLKFQDSPKVVIYNFAKNKYFVDNKNIQEMKTADNKVSEKAFEKNLYDLIDRIEKNSIIMFTGSFFDDLFAKMGFEITEGQVQYIVIGFFVFVVLFLLIAICFFNDKNFEEERIEAETKRAQEEVQKKTTEKKNQ
jgi:hypothetical protein